MLKKVNKIISGRTHSLQKLLFQLIKFSFHINKGTNKIFLTVLSSVNLIFEFVNYIGIIAFAISGSMKAIKKGMDLLGVIILGISTSLGGGIIADVLLGKTPPTNLTYYPYVLTSIISSLITFTFYKIFTNVRKPLLYADAIGLSAFASSGASLAFSFSHNFLLVTAIGTITAVGGGVIRDVLSAEIPLILTREFYATAAFIGATVYYALRIMGYTDIISTTISFLITLTLRILAMKYNWELPKIEVK